MVDINKPYFSVVIPALNEEKALPQLLGDLARQTFKDFEVIIVDGHSDDKTVGRAKNFEKKFQKLQIVNSDIRQQCFQRNLGAKHSAASWIIFMDADNRLPDYFLQGIKFKIELHKPHLLSTWLIPDSNNRTDKSIALFLNILIDLQKTSATPYIQESLLVIRKDVFERLKGFDEKLHWGEGNDLLSRANRLRYKFHFTREPKYVFSFRRFRKLGTLRGLGRSTQMDIARLLHIKLSKEKAERLYPLEGGQYFEFDPKEKSTIENLLLRLFRKENGEAKENKSKNILQVLKEKLF